MRHLIAVFGLLSATACADAVTAPVPVASGETSGAVAQRAGGLRYVPQGQAAYTCEFQIKDKAGVVRTREKRVQFRTSEVHPTGAERGYIYRGYAGREVVVLARCTIPATDGALARMNRWFKVSSDQQAQQPAPALMSNLGTGDCCTLPTVVVTGCQYGGLTFEDGGCNSQPVEDYANCYYFGECGGSPGSGGDEGGGGTPPPTVSPYEEGPLFWTACVLAVMGTVYTVDQVSDQFTAWYYAQRDYEAAKRMVDAINQNGDNTPRAIRELYEYKLEQAAQRRDDAMAAVRGATNGSYWALAGAAVACGATMFAPTF